MIFDQTGCRACRRIQAPQLAFTVLRVSKLSRKQDIRRVVMIYTTLLALQPCLSPLLHLMQGGRPAITKEQTSRLLVMICLNRGPRRVDGGMQHLNDMTQIEDVPPRGQW